NALLESSGGGGRAYCYELEREDYRLFSSGKTRLALGVTRVRSEILLDSGTFVFAVVHLGEHNLKGGIRKFSGTGAYETMVEETKRSVSSGDLAETIRLVDQFFDRKTFTLKALFREEQRRMIGRILESAIEEASATYRRLYDQHAPMMRFLLDIGFQL